MRPTKDLEWFFDCLEGSVRKCPGGDGCKKTLSLAAILVHLNDEHRWSREADRRVAGEWRTGRNSARGRLQADSSARARYIARLRSALSRSAAGRPQKPSRRPAGLLQRA